jgi:dihydroflavonol-4-reductase
LHRAQWCATTPAPMPTAFVTGATGFLGQHVVEQLLHAGYRVVALHRADSDVSRLAPLDVTLARGSIEDAEAVERALPERCDAVFHVAGNISFWSQERAAQTLTNVIGTRNVVRAAIKRRVGTLVHTSSESAYAYQAHVPFDETAPSTALSSPVNYERSKYQAELEVRAGVAEGLRAVIINPSNILGRYDRRGWVEFLVSLARQELPAVPPGGMSFCAAEEVARAHLSAVERGKSGENYLLGGADATYLELCQRAAKILGVPAPTRTVPSWAFRAIGRLADWQSYVTRRAPTITPEIAHIATRGPGYVRCDKAVRELGYRPVSLDDMLISACTWAVEEFGLEIAGASALRARAMRS